MATATETKQANALVTKYLTLYQQKIGRAPTNFNRYKHRWGFSSMIEDLGYPAAGEVIEYYFDIKRDFDPVELFSNYHVYWQRLEEHAADFIEREKLREETRKRVQEWEKQNGGSSGGTD